jgi:ubiquinone/menaquinone biosynthesis C-methylase UbiE
MKKGLIKGKRARKYAEVVKKDEKTEIFNNFILKNFKLSKSVKVADFCCGSGNTIELLKDRVKEIVGIDGSEEMIKICKEKFGKNKRVKLKLSDVEKTDLKSNYFDYAVIRMALHHIKDKEKVMGEIYRVLKPKGRVIAIDKFYFNKFEFYLGEILAMFKFDFEFFNHYVVSREEYERVLSQKFKIIKKVILPVSKKGSRQKFMIVLKKKS